MIMVLNRIVIHLYVDGVWTMSGWCFGGVFICVRCLEGVKKVFGWCLDSVLMMGYCLDGVWSLDATGMVSGQWLGNTLTSVRCLVVV